MQLRTLMSNKNTQRIVIIITFGMILSVLARVVSTAAPSYDKQPFGRLMCDQLCQKISGCTFYTFMLPDLSCRLMYDNVRPWMRNNLTLTYNVSQINGKQRTAQNCLKQFKMFKSRKGKIHCEHKKVLRMFNLFSIYVIGTRNTCENELSPATKYLVKREDIPGYPYAVGVYDGTRKVPVTISRTQRGAFVYLMDFHLTYNFMFVLKQTHPCQPNSGGSITECVAGFYFSEKNIKTIQRTLETYDIEYEIKN